MPGIRERQRGKIRSCRPHPLERGMKLLEKRIDDVKFLNAIRKMLKAGYVEDWKFQNSYSGTPQGGVISPILANIYLHELDCHVEQLICTFSRGKKRAVSTEYNVVAKCIGRLNKKIKQEADPQERKNLLDQKKELQRQQLEIPSNNQHDPKFRRLRYCRYADDFLLSVIGPKEEAEEIYRNIEGFLTDELKLKTSRAKSGLKHNTEVVRFLGYDITVRSTERTVKGKVYGQHYKKRSMKGQISLLVPEAKTKLFAEKHGYGNLITMRPEDRPYLRHASDAEIALRYSTEMRGLAQYYVLTDNFQMLGKLRYLWIQSFLKTMAGKYNTTMQKVATMLNRGSYMAVRVEGKGKTREIKLFRLADVNRKVTYENVDNPPLTRHYTSSTELLQRMDANKCEYCETEGGYFEVHHVRKLADIKDGKQPWQRFMIARKRKTIVLCVNCHQKLTYGKLPDRRHLVK